MPIAQSFRKWFPGLVAAALLIAAGFYVRVYAQGGAPSGSAATFFWVACTHDEWNSPSTYICPDTAQSLITFSGDQIASGSMSIALKDGRKLTMAIPAGTDAVFLSDHAITKFIRPYYVAQHAEKKVAVLDAFSARLKAASMRKAATKKP